MSSQFLNHVKDYEDRNVILLKTNHVISQSHFCPLGTLKLFTQYGWRR